MSGRSSTPAQRAMLVGLVAFIVLGLTDGALGTIWPDLRDEFGRRDGHFGQVFACLAGGYLVASEVSWFRPDPPQEVSEFWAENYPAIRTVEENLAAASQRGWLPVGHFHLPKEGWVEEYYKQLGERLPEFRQANADDPNAQAVADLTEHEMSMFSRYSDAYGYEFYVFRRID